MEKSYKEYLKTDHRNYVLRTVKDPKEAERKAKWDIENAGKTIVYGFRAFQPMRKYKPRNELNARATLSQ